MTRASFCSWAGRIVSYLVAHHEDRLSRDVAHLCSTIKNYKNPKKLQERSEDINETPMSVRAASSEGAWFRSDPGTNLIRQGEIVTGWLCGSVVRVLWVRVPVGLCAFSSPVTHVPISIQWHSICELILSRNIRWFTHVWWQEVIPESYMKMAL